MSTRALLLALTVAVVFGFWRPDSIEPQTLDAVAHARQALDAGRVDEAIAMLEKTVTDEPTNPAALAWLGSAQVRKASTLPPAEAAGWVKRGFDTMDEAVERFPDAFVVYAMRGITAGRVPELFHKTDVAIGDLGRVIALKQARPQAVPDTVMPGVYLNLGLAQKKAGRPADARATWEAARRLYPAAPERAAIERALGSL